MKIIATGDWHLGNLFHGNDRLHEHKHFLAWLLENIEDRQPDALLVAGDVFDNGNPSAAAQEAYYEFLAAATRRCPKMLIVITAGNHDSAYRLEAPRAMLSCNRVEIRGAVHRQWIQDDDGGGSWGVDYDDLIIPVEGADGCKVAVLAVPYLRTDVLQGSCYSEGVNTFIRQLSRRAHELYPEHILVMMAHIYAKGSDIAANDASEKIVIGGQEEVTLVDWPDHPDYFTCGHIHKRQHIWDTDWARYTGSVLPMSFAEKDYRHGVDMITVEGKRKIKVEFLEYMPQHQLCVLPEDDEELTAKRLERLVKKNLDDRVDGELDDHFKYVVLKVKLDKVKNDELKKLEDLVNSKNAVLCKIQKIMEHLELATITGDSAITSVDDILNRDPLDTLKEAFAVKHDKEMSPRQEELLKDLLSGVNN